VSAPYVVAIAVVFFGCLAVVVPSLVGRQLGRAGGWLLLAALLGIQIWDAVRRREPIPPADSEQIPL
jgi:hypothetical protein